MLNNTPKTDGDESAGSKRRRAPNFTDKEIRTLVKLVFEHIEIIESKKTDSETWRVKDLVWNNITENFNNSLWTNKRTVEMVRQKYDSLKKIARKKEARNREEGLKEEPDYVDMEDYEKDLIRLLEPIGQVYESATVLLPETKLSSTNIKSETNAGTQSSNPPDHDNMSFVIADEELRSTNIKSETNPGTQSGNPPDHDNMSFIITDDDILWDLPSDTVNRPRLQLIKKQLEQLEREDQRQLLEHQYRMKNEAIKRKFILSEERRANAEHKKRMELLDLEIQLKQQALAKASN